MPRKSSKRATKAREDDIARTLEEVRGKLARLDKMDDEISKRISALEKALVEFGFCVCVSTLIRDYVDEETGMPGSVLLVFEKHAGKWRFTLADGYHDVEDWFTRPLLDCSREERADALQHHIPALLKKASRVLNATLKDRQDALDSSSHLLSAIAGSDGSEEAS